MSKEEEGRFVWDLSSSKWSVSLSGEKQKDLVNRTLSLPLKTQKITHFYFFPSHHRLLSRQPNRPESEKNKETHLQ